MDELDLSKQELEQSQEEYKKTFTEYRRILQETLENKERELIKAQADHRRLQNELNLILGQQEVLKERLRETEVELLSWKKEATTKKTTLKLQGFLSSIIFLLSMALTIIGTNLISSTPSLSLGWIIIALAGVTFIFAAFITTSITFEKGQLIPVINSDTRAYPPPHPEEFEILRKEIVYEYEPDGKTMYQRKRLQIRALKDGQILYTDRYRWSGSGKCLIRSLTSGFQITNAHKGEVDVWDYFDVLFPHPLHKGDEVDFTIEWELVDEQKRAIAFLSTMIDRDTDYLLLQVILPPELAPKRAYLYEYQNYLDTLPIVAQEAKWSPASRSIIYEVNKPMKYHKYSIRWYND